MLSESLSYDFKSCIACYHQENNFNEFFLLIVPPPKSCSQSPSSLTHSFLSGSFPAMKQKEAV